MKCSIAARGSPLSSASWPSVSDVRAPSRADDPAFREWWSSYLRMGASPGAAVALTRMNAEIDIRDVLPSIASWTRHFMLNPIVELDGARATGRWSALVHAVFKASADAGPQRLYVRYQDSYKKTDDGWRLQAVIALFDTPG